jgi:hypothetical protein
MHFHAFIRQLLNTLLKQLQTHKFQAHLHQQHQVLKTHNLTHKFQAHLNKQHQVLKTHNITHKIKLLIYQLFKFLILYLYLALMENVLIYSA